MWTQNLICILFNFYFLPVNVNIVSTFVVLLHCSYSTCMDFEEEAFWNAKGSMMCEEEDWAEIMEADRMTAQVSAIPLAITPLLICFLHIHSFNQSAHIDGMGTS